MGGRGPFLVVLPEQTEKTQQAVCVLSPEPFRLAWEASESRGCGLSRTCLKGAPGDSPPCVTRPGPAPCTPSSVPLPWASPGGGGGVPAWWVSPGSTECPSLEGPPGQPCGSPSSPQGLALPQDGGPETPSTTPAEASRGLDWLLAAEPCLLRSTEGQGHFEQPHGNPQTHTSQSCGVLCGGGPAGFRPFPGPC